MHWKCQQTVTFDLQRSPLIPCLYSFNSLLKFFLISRFFCHNKKKKNNFSSPTYPVPRNENYQTVSPNLNNHRRRTMHPSWPHTHPRTAISQRQTRRVPRVRNPSRGLVKPAYSRPRDCIHTHRLSASHTEQ